ncbi:MAG: Maf family protein [Deltaproteobacteria bacterium]
MIDFDLKLASTSVTRREMLEKAGVAVTCHAPRVDERMIRDAMLAEGATPRDIADALAEAKARKIGSKFPTGLTLGADQVLDLKGKLFSKPETPEAAIAQLSELRGEMHSLFSAAVIYEDGKPVWRHISEARLYMRDVSTDYISDYVGRNWPGIGASVGAYKIEEEGVRLFHRIDGDHFTILGLPLLPLLSWFGVRGLIAS